MLLFTLFSHSAEQRAGGCQQLWGTRRLPGSPAQPIQGRQQTGYRSSDTEHLYSDGTLCQQPARQARGGRTSGLSTCHRFQIFFGGQCRKPHLQLGLNAADRTD